ncbi:molybdopterin molybdotransferase MoeA [Demequina globuliformis]|uniref:molybdopterin molybdotransferase MoeA n=1 Tax=Demequina globuliformis TaxID=676202 RepID=UPI000780BB21|nr:gephyrin-like molybdotransferase Glp [Demequina globuliformis]
MRPVDEHVAHAVSLMAPVDLDEVALAEAFGRVLARTVTARYDSPRFDNSAMDGYAVRAAEVTVGTRMRVAADIPAGSGEPPALHSGTCARIMTGAPVPHGADAVIPVEHTDAATAEVTFYQSAVTGAHIRRAGEDARAGDAVVAAGQLLGAWQLSAAASAGHATVAVRRRPVVAVLATGDELVDPGMEPGPGQIVDSNSTLLSMLVTAVGGVPVVLPRCPDRPGAVAAALAGVDADLIVTAGGASVGAYDPVKADLAGHGVEFFAVAMQPGKPQGLGTVNGIPIACLPGNPVSVAVTFHVVVGPMLRALLGAVEPKVLAAPAAEGWKCPAGRAQFVPAVVESDGSVRPATGGGSRSHLVASLAAGRVLAVVPAEVEQVYAGDTVGIMTSILENMG